MAQNSGITPAYAGKSYMFECWTVTKWDHPRLRGEKLISWIRLVLRLGSPPLTRGKVTDAVESLPSTRITPAYAGKSK